MSTEAWQKRFNMRLALKLVLVFMLANIALAGIYGYLAVQREVDLFKNRAAAEADEFGPVILELLADEERLADQKLWSAGSYDPTANCSSI